MRNEMSIVDRLITKKAVAQTKTEGPSLNEGLQFTLLENSSPEFVGKMYKVVANIPVNEKEEIDTEKFLFVKESKEGNLEVEVRNADDKVIGILASTEAAFEQLISSKSIEEIVVESVATVQEGTEVESEEAEESLTEAVDPKLIKDVADAIADEDYEVAQEALTKIDSDEDIFDSLVSAVAESADVDAEEAEEMVEDFLDEIDVEEEEDLDERVKLVVRKGEVKRINIPIRRKRISAKQRAALKKARRKAHTGKAKRRRKKSMIIRRRRLGEAMEMLDSVASTIESFGVEVTKKDLEMTHESVDLEVTLSNADNFEINLSEMETYFSEQFNAEVEIPDAEFVNEGQEAVLKLIVK